jgi:NhaP-type Na+/H+ or K+/H+ antiporter
MNLGFFCKFFYIFLFRNNHEYSDLGQNLILINFAFVIVLLALAATVYPINSVVNRFGRKKIPSLWSNIVMIGGMRGAVAVALVASLPAGQNDRDGRDGVP